MDHTLGLKNRTMQLTFSFEIRVDIAASIDTRTLRGNGGFVPITGGTVSGPALTGKVLPAGGDWFRNLDAECCHVDAMYLLQSEDGVTIRIHNPGVYLASEEVNARLERGLTVPAQAYYFRTTPRFDAPEGRYGWLSRRVFVADASDEDGQIVIRVYAVE
ncbi:hypothetical protein A6456_35900 [Paraburkholderia tropica]|nr:hypothetical protein A6456_35900 [Paraburkholderia tropica]